jgi:hypothetical protein
MMRRIVMMFRDRVQLVEEFLLGRDRKCDAEKLRPFDLEPGLDAGSDRAIVILQIALRT